MDDKPPQAKLKHVLANILQYKKEIIQKYNTNCLTNDPVTTYTLIIQKLDSFVIKNPLNTGERK